MSKNFFLDLKFSFSRKWSVKPKSKPTQPTTSFKEIQSPSFSSKVYEPNMEEMKKVFNKFDGNGDGKISLQEYKSSLKMLGKRMKDREVVKEFNAMDTDNDGFVDFKEFMGVHSKTGSGGVKKSDIESAFQAFDMDGDGKIKAEELREFMRRIEEPCSLEACRKMIKGVDKDGDGFINRDEFMCMMTRTMKLT